MKYISTSSACQSHDRMYLGGGEASFCPTEVLFPHLNTKREKVVWARDFPVVRVSVLSIHILIARPAVEIMVLIF